MNPIPLPKFFLVKEEEESGAETEKKEWHPLAEERGRSKSTALSPRRTSTSLLTDMEPYFDTHTLDLAVSSGADSSEGLYGEYGLRALSLKRVMVSVLKLLLDPDEHSPDSAEVKSPNDSEKTRGVGFQGLFCGLARKPCGRVDQRRKTVNRETKKFQIFLHFHIRNIRTECNHLRHFTISTRFKKIWGRCVADHL